MQKFGARGLAILFAGLLVGGFLQQQGTSICTNGPEYFGWWAFAKLVFIIGSFGWIAYCAGREAGRYY